MRILITFEYKGKAQDYSTCNEDVLFETIEALTNAGAVITGVARQKPVS